MFRPSVESNEMTLFFFDKKNASISGRLVEDSNRDFTAMTGSMRVRVMMTLPAARATMSSTAVRAMMCSTAAMMTIAFRAAMVPTA